MKKIIITEEQKKNLFENADHDKLLGMLYSGELENIELVIQIMPNIEGAEERIKKLIWNISTFNGQQLPLVSYEKFVGHKSPKFVEAYMNLTSLYLDGDVKHLGDFTCYYPKVKYINFDAADIQSIEPKFFACGGKWYGVNLSDNNIKEIPSTIGNCVSLTRLDLSRNQLEHLPNEMERLKNLSYLDLSHNNLKEIPEFIQHLPKLNTLDLGNNPIQSAPDWFLKLHLKIDSFILDGEMLSDEAWERIINAREIVNQLKNG